MLAVYKTKYLLLITSSFTLFSNFSAALSSTLLFTGTSYAFYQACDLSFSFRATFYSTEISKPSGMFFFLVLAIRSNVKVQVDFKFFLSLEQVPTCAYTVVNMFKIQFFAQFLVEHFSHSIMFILVFFLD